jgi:hypothetical protein
MTPGARANRVIELFKLFQPLAAGRDFAPMAAQQNIRPARVQNPRAARPKQCADPLPWPLAGAKLLAPVQLKVAGESLKVSLETATVKDRRDLSNDTEGRENEVR